MKITKHSIQVMSEFVMQLFVWDNNYIEEIKDASMLGFKSCHYNYIAVAIANHWTDQTTGRLKLTFSVLPLASYFYQCY